MATYPAAPAPAKVTIGSVAHTSVRIAHDGTRRAIANGGQRWRFRLEYAPGNDRDDIAALLGFLYDLRGRYGTCDFAVPMLGTMRGSGAGSENVLLPRNMVSNSEDFTLSDWNKSGSCAQRAYYIEPPDLGAVAPIVNPAQSWGGAAGAWHYVRNYISATTANDNVVSCYFHDGDADRSGVALTSYSGAADTLAGVASWYWNASGEPYNFALSGAGGDNGGIESVGNGWYRAWMYMDGTTVNGDDLYVTVYPAINESSTYTYLFGAHLDQGVKGPTAYYPTGSAEVNTAQDTYGSTLYLRGFTGDASNVVRAGDFLKLPGQDKLYMAARDIDAASDGHAALWLSSPMTDTPSTSDVPDFTSLTCKAALSGDTQPVTVDTALHYGLTVNLIEVNL
jgi:hypothetical protein